MSVTELHPRHGEDAGSGTREAAQAEAIRAKTAAEAETRRIANQVKAAKAAKDIAAGEAEAERIRQAAATERQAAQEEQEAERARRTKAERSARQWRRSALGIAIVCVLVSLPLQMMAFYSHKAPFLLLAPLVLEGLAWALLKGAEAAIDEGRPSWHYRLGAGLVALFAASVNFLHGSAAFGAATGLGGAFCSLAGPLVWDLHEHGRIRARDHRTTRAQRRAEKAAEKEEAARRDHLAAARASEWGEVWERAVALAAALGERHPGDATWKRAWEDVHGTAIGDTAQSIAARVAAKAGAKEAAREAPAKQAAEEAVTRPNAQIESQMTPTRRRRPAGAADGRRRNGGTPPQRHAGDTPRYSEAARVAMSLAARTRRGQTPARR